MKVKHTLYLKVSRTERNWKFVEGLVDKYFESINKAEPLHPSQVMLEIMDSDVILFEIEDELKKQGIIYKHIKRRTYNKNEIKSSQYALMSVSTPWFQQGKYAEDFGANYTIPKCPDCNSGKVQVGNIYVPEKKAMKYDICSMLPEMIINDKIQNILELHCCSGYKLQDVYCYKSHTVSTLKQLIPINILPPMAKSTGAIIKNCPNCNTEQIDYVFDEIVYEKLDLSVFADINYTKELFTTKSPNGIPSGLCIVSNKIISLFLDYQVRNIQFEPVRFVCT